MKQMLTRDVNRWTAIMSNPELHTREGIEAFVDTVVNLPGSLGNDPYPLFHSFSGGVYSREVHLPAGHVVVGKIHKQKSLVNVISGKLLVADETGFKIIEGPCKFESDGGIRRVAFIVSDTVWIDYHHTDSETIPEAEAEIFAADYNELEFSDMVKSIGYTEKEVSDISRNETDVITDKQPGVSVKPSDIQGVGVFAEKKYREGDMIGRALIGQRRTLIGRYTNHSPNPNCKKTPLINGIAFSAMENINAGDELTVNYVNVAESKL